MVDNWYQPITVHNRAGIVKHIRALLNRQVFHVFDDINGVRNFRRDRRAPLSFEWLEQIPTPAGFEGRYLGLYVPGRQNMFGNWSRKDVVRLDVELVHSVWVLLGVLAHELIHRHNRRAEGLVVLNKSFTL